jgi:DNA topoisomerase-2
LYRTRALGGKDAASARYIFTRLNPSTVCLFPAVDLPLLKYVQDDGKQVEPTNFVPVIPMVLVNGAAGIGTGWSTNVPSYNYRDLVRNILCLLDGKDPSEMTPWYRGFKGTIVKNSTGTGFLVRGVIYFSGDTTIAITDLPVGKWNRDYKLFLEKLVSVNKIVTFTEHHTDHEVCFKLHITSVQRQAIEQKGVGLYKYFQLESLIHTTNMVLHDAQGQLKRYSGPLEMLSEYYAVRLHMYAERRQYTISNLGLEMGRLEQRICFIAMVIRGDIVIRDRTKVDLFIELEKKGFSKREEKFDYLLNLPLWSLTRERVKSDEDVLAQLKTEKQKLINTTPEELWKSDLTRVVGLMREEEDVFEEEKRKTIPRVSKKAHPRSHHTPLQVKRARVR